MSNLPPLQDYEAIRKTPLAEEVFRHGLVKLEAAYAEIDRAEAGRAYASHKRIVKQLDTAAMFGQFTTIGELANAVASMKFGASLIGGAEQRADQLAVHKMLDAFTDGVCEKLKIDKKALPTSRNLGEVQIG